jgi:hypothetical protein
MVLALNTISGQIADVSPKMLQHPKFKDILEVVDEGSKPYVAELYKGGSKKEKAARKPKFEAVEVEVEEELVVETESIEIEEEI